MIRSFAAFLAAIISVVLTMPAHADDAQIASQIVQRLRAQQQTSNLRGFNIGVQVDDGTVTMLGQVADQSQAGLALDIARRVPGVKLVVNDLGVGNAEQITQTPQSNPTMPGGNIRLAAAASAGRQPVQQAIPQLTRPVATGTGVAAAPASQQPLAFAPATAPQSIRTASAMPGMMGGAPEMVGGSVIQGGPPSAGGPAPTPMNFAGGVSTASYDNAQLPGYSWPSYSAYPNYGAVTYPQQYSPTAWPYIGPFYPYPQVPLGWRKVQLEWDDGWWFLDFKSK